MSNETARNELIAELEADGDSYFSGGFWNNIIDLSLTVLTVFASLVATILASANSPHIAKWVIAAVAAVPAGAASLQRIVGIRERSNWYFLYAAEVRALATRLRYADSPSTEEFANHRADLEVEMEEKWLKIGHSGRAPSGRAAARTRRHRTPQEKNS